MRFTPMITALAVALAGLCMSPTPTEAAESKRVRLKWGAPTQPVLMQGAAPRRYEDDDEEGTTADYRTEADRGWRFRIAPFNTAFIFGDIDEPMVFEHAIQFEIDDEHIINLQGMWMDDMYGGGAGYAYQLDLVRDIALLDFGAIAGWFAVEDDGDYWGDYSNDEEYLFTMINVNVSAGYHFVFVTVGARIGIGTTVVGGVSLGLTLRI